MSFRKRRGVRLSYNRQGLVHFTCLDYRNQPTEVRRKIRELCRSAGGEYSEALFEALTTDRSAVQICQRHYIASPTTLYEMRRKFYERW